MASNKLGRFKTYRQEYNRDRRRGNKYQGQIEARLEADRQESDQETKVSVTATY